jgi:hypothetical protein
MAAVVRLCTLLFLLIGPGWMAPAAPRRATYFDCAFALVCQDPHTVHCPLTFHEIGSMHRGCIESSVDDLVAPPSERAVDWLRSQPPLSPFRWKVVRTVLVLARTDGLNCLGDDGNDN